MTEQKKPRKRETSKGAESAGVPVPAPVDLPPIEQILDTDVVNELEASFLEYSMSVIVARALPDVRDGLKPVHRRVLYSLFEQGIRPATPHKKCARVVGDVMGKYHPHGDSSIYEALVRMAQPWSMQLLLVDGHGNFGSPDDGPAAMRYTECRMSPASFSMVEELDEETVEFVPNYDQTETEPEVLPARIPNLLVNGSTGIAVGMATNMAPHNLREVVAGLQALLADPKLGIDDFMSHVPGPDFPTGGLVIGGAGVRDAYTTGRGQFRIRARTTIENTSARRRGIVVTELPYSVGPEKVIAKIKELTNQKRLTGVADVKDLTDRKTGLRLVIECKTGFEPEAVLADLFRLTPLEESFSVNNVALVRGEPRTLGVLDLAREFLAHRLDVVRRRSEYRKARAEARAHIVEGLVLALASIDEVVALLKASKDTETARARLMKTFDLSEIQANAILEMTLRRLTSLEVTKLRTELKELKSLIAELSKLLSSEKLMRKVVGDELVEVAATYGSDRRSQLLDELSLVSVPSPTLPEISTVVSLNPTGQVSRVDEGTTHRPSRLNIVNHRVTTGSRGHLGVVTDKGRLLRLSVASLPAVSGKASGVPLREYVELAVDEQPVALVSLDSVLALATRDGVVKRIRPETLPSRSGTSVISLRDGDAVVGVVSHPVDVADTVDLVMISTAGQLLRFPSTSVRPQGHTAGGMTGMRLGDGDFVLTLGSSHGAPVVASVTDSGSVKLTPLDDYPVKGRGTGGVRCHTFRKDDTTLALAFVGDGPIVANDQSGNPIEIPSDHGKRDGSGVRVEPMPTGIGNSPR
jgi:DNA gyrase subunit A